jgi:hypothetical protein
VGKEISNLSFTFISPLSTNNSKSFHRDTPL